jgi:predicted RNA-binding protein
MCEVHAYLLKEGEEEMIMESVDIVSPEGSDDWDLVGIFGERKTVRGRIKGINLGKHKIVFEAKNGG